MREVDFRPDCYVLALAERAGARVHVSGFIVMACLLLVWWADATSRGSAATVAVAQLADAVAVQDPMVAHLGRLNREIEVRRRDHRLLVELSGGLPTSDVLAEIAHLAPPSLSLRTLVLERSPRVVPVGNVDAKVLARLPKRTTLELTGWAASGEDIANLVSGMANSPLFTEVSLGYERSETVEDRLVVAFQVVCHMPQFE